MFTSYLRGFIHDIRTSVGIIQTCLDPGVCKDHLEDEVDFVIMARNQATKALDLVAQLEDTVVQNDERFTSNPVSGSDIHTLLDGFVALYPKVRVRFDASHLLQVHTDLTLLRRVVDNCIANAFRAGQSEWVLLAATADDDVLQLEIKDGGVGMTQKQLERIGLGFSTTGGGDGTKILIDLLTRAGGTIRWSSIKDVGTCVTVTFKLTDGHKLIEAERVEETHAH